MNALIARSHWNIVNQGRMGATALPDSGRTSMMGRDNGIALGINGVTTGAVPCVSRQRHDTFTSRLPNSMVAAYSGFLNSADPLIFLWVARAIWCAGRRIGDFRKPGTRIHENPAGSGLQAGILIDRYVS